MKKDLIKLLIVVVNNNFFWFFLRPIIKTSFFLSRLKKNKKLENDDNNYFENLFIEKIVLNGPFKDMKYPSFKSVGSAFYPKLLGSYERELHEIIREICKKSYTEIIDIGCAEGYYAVGLGMKITSALVYAYDIDESARNLTLQMASINKIENRLIIKEEMTINELSNFNFTERGLIICDCEGYEYQLFNEESCKNLGNCDLLIETHDFIDLNISINLKKLFFKTHKIKSIYSVDDIYKAHNYEYPELRNINIKSKLNLLKEWRPSIMEWIYCTPINNH